MNFILNLFARAIANKFLGRIGAAKMISIIVRLIFACQISPGVRIGRNLSLGYGGLGIVIHGDTWIGDDVAIGPHVIIGGNLGKGGVPKIGDRVRIGPGSYILGPVTIGDGVIVAANSVVTADVEPGAVVGGSPAKVLGKASERLGNE